MKNGKEYWCDYQPFLLNKEMARRIQGETEIIGLDKVEGLRLLATSVEELGLLQKYKSNGSGSIGCEVVIGIFIEPGKLSKFNATMDQVAKNLDDFKENGISVLCVAIFDGRKKLNLTSDNELIRQAFAAKFYNERKITEEFNLSKENDDISPRYLVGKSNGSQEDKELAHMFMHKDWPEGNYNLSLDLIFCIKENYSGKLNSHLWFFGGFCHHINPRVVILLDAGIEPENNALFYLYRALRADKNLAGCTGELKPKPKDWKHVLRRAQIFEYKTIYMLDKALESVFGYISSLPSYFSAYKWKALSMDILMETHFKSICHPEEIVFSNSNYYLSVDKLLSLSLFMQKNQRYTLRYVKNSKANINVSKKIYKIMLIRRKWINGTWFILLESLRKSHLILCCKTNHPWYRIILFAIQMVLFITNFFFSWMIVGYFFVFLAQGLRKKAENDDWDPHVQDIFMIFYGLILEYILIISLGVSPRRANKSLTYITAILVLISGASIYFFLRYWFQELDGSYSEIYYISLFISIGLFFLNMLFHLYAFWSIPQYTILIPVLVNICMIYSICNIHDCSNSDPEKITEKEREQIVHFQSFRAFWLVFWILSNGIFAYGLYEFIEANWMNTLMAIAMIGMVNIIIRLAGGLIYHAKEWYLNNHDQNFDLAKYSDEELLQNMINNSAQNLIEVPSLTENSSLNE